MIAPVRDANAATGFGRFISALPTAAASVTNSNNGSPIEIARVFPSQSKVKQMPNLLSQ
jgi:hypothetical protein